MNDSNGAKTLGGVFSATHKGYGSIIGDALFDENCGLTVLYYVHIGFMRQTHLSLNIIRIELHFLVGNCIEIRIIPLSELLLRRHIAESMV